MKLILPGAAYIGQHGKGGCRGSFRTGQDRWRRAAATKTLGRLSILGDWEDGNWTKSEGNSFVSVKKGPGKRTDWRSRQEEGIGPWYLGKGGGVVICCNAGQTEQGWPQQGNRESLLVLRQQRFGTRYGERENMKEFDS